MTDGPIARVRRPRRAATASRRSSTASSMSVHGGGFVSVIGPNGAGKSTLLKAVYGVRRAQRRQRPRARRDGERATSPGCEPHELTRLGLNYVPQLENVFPSLSVSRTSRSAPSGSERDRRRRLEAVLRHVSGAPRAAPAAGGHALRRRAQDARAGACADARPAAAPARRAVRRRWPRRVDELFAKLVEINGSGSRSSWSSRTRVASLALSDYGYVLDMGRNRYEGPAATLLDDPKVARALPRRAWALAVELGFHLDLDEHLLRNKARDVEGRVRRVDAAEQLPVGAHRLAPIGLAGQVQA